jgi:hypothetical protein
VTNVNFEKWAEYLSDRPLRWRSWTGWWSWAMILKLKGKSDRA